MEADEFNYGSPTPETDNSRWELDTSDVIFTIEQELRRMTIDKNGNWIQRVHAKALMNEEGISNIVSILKSFLNKNNALANIKETDAHNITSRISEVVINQIQYNHKIWNLKKVNFDYVVALIDSQVFLFLTRPVHDKERRHRRKFGYAEHYNHDEVSPEEIKGGTSEVKL